MKGLIFSELVDFVERHASLVQAEEIIDQAKLDNDGAFTTVGNYPHTEAIKLVMTASEHLGIAADDLMRQFGRELFDTLLKNHPQFFADESQDIYSFLQSLQDHIHVEVEKLYPGANPPTVTTDAKDGHMMVTYESHRPFALIAFGLLEGSCAHFDENLIVRMEKDSDNSATRATFTVTRSAAE